MKWLLRQWSWPASSSRRSVFEHNDNQIVRSVMAKIDARDQVKREAFEDKLDIVIAGGTISVVVVSALLGFLYLMIYERAPTGGSPTSAPVKQPVELQTTTTPPITPPSTQPSTK
jgi:hypothetical protein